MNRKTHTLIAAIFMLFCGTASAQTFNTISNALPSHLVEKSNGKEKRGIRGETSIAELCRKYGITTSTFYAWNKEFIEAGKRQLAGDTLRQATSNEVNALRKENQALKENLADLVVRYDIVKKKLENA